MWLTRYLEGSRNLHIQERELLPLFLIYCSTARTCLGILRPFSSWCSPSCSLLFVHLCSDYSTGLNRTKLIGIPWNCRSSLRLPWLHTWEQRKMIFICTGYYVALAEHDVPYSQSNCGKLMMNKMEFDMLSLPQRGANKRQKHKCLCIDCNDWLYPNLMECPKWEQHHQQI